MSLIDDGEVEIKINESFAKDYSERKRKEELANLKDKFKHVDDDRARRLAELRRKYGPDASLSDDSHSGSDGESGSDTDDEEEDEVGELVTPEVDAQILRTMALIRNRDPAVYASDTQFFSEKELEKAQRQWKEKQLQLRKQSKKITLKDLERDQVLKGIVDADAAEAEELGVIKKEQMTHVEEQAQLKEAFKSAAFDDGPENNEDDMFLTRKHKTDDDLAREEEEYKNFLLESMAQAGGEDYFLQLKSHQGHSAPLDENEKFLMDYLLNRGWIDKEDKKEASDKIWHGDQDHPIDQNLDDGEDEKDLDAIDDFEREYNFRFEEAQALEGGVSIKSHSRNIEDSLRRKDDKRKRERQKRAERKEQEKLQKQEELKRYKNLKREEIREKLRELAEITGNKNAGFDEVDLEADFDPEDWDKKMNTIFDEEFYNAEEAEKPEWDNDIDITDVIQEQRAQPEPPSKSEPDAAAQKSKKKKKKRKQEDANDDFIEIPDADALDEQPQVVEQRAKTANAPGQAQLDELYKLDYEDIVAGIPTRFRYRETQPITFGLSVEDILEAEDADLNQFVSLKKLAPYRSEEKVAKDVKKLSSKRRLREFKILQAKRASSQPPKDQKASEPSAEQAAQRLAAYEPQKKRKKTSRK